MWHFKRRGLEAPEPHIEREPEAHAIWFGAYSRAATEAEDRPLPGGYRSTWESGVRREGALDIRPAIGYLEAYAYMFGLRLLPNGTLAKWEYNESIALYLRSLETMGAMKVLLGDGRETPRRDKALNTKHPQ